MPSCEISDCAQISKTIIAVRHFGLGGRESLETAVNTFFKQRNPASFDCSKVYGAILRASCRRLQARIPAVTFLCDVDFIFFSIFFSKFFFQSFSQDFSVL